MNNFLIASQNTGEQNYGLAWDCAYAWHSSYVQTTFAGIITDLEHYLSEKGKFLNSSHLDTYWQEEIENHILNDGSDLIYTNRASMFLLVSPNSEAWKDLYGSDNSAPEKHIQAAFALCIDLRYLWLRHDKTQYIMGGDDDFQDEPTDNLYHDCLMCDENYTTRGEVDAKASMFCKSCESRI